MTITDWLILVGLEVVWLTGTVVLTWYQTHKRNQWLQQMKYLDEKFHQAVRELSDARHVQEIQQERDEAVDLLRLIYDSDIVAQGAESEEFGDIDDALRNFFHPEDEEDEGKD